MSEEAPRWTHDTDRSHPRSRRHAQLEAERLAGTCQWFLLCTNEATHTHDHPILGPVPICDRCEDLT